MKDTFTRILAVLPLLTGPAFAQDEAVTIITAESEEHGTYLTDGDGMSVYLFEADTQGQGDTTAVMTCEGECLEAWPPVMTQGEPVAGEGADAELLGILTHDGGTMHVTYNGWPLYYYHEDTEAGDTSGHDIEEFGAEWYLLTAEGEKAGEEEEEASAGTAGDTSVTPEIVTEGVTIEGDTATIPRVVAEQDSYVVIHAMLDGQPVVPASIGHTAVSEGVNEDVVVTIDYPFAEGETYMAMLHAETNDNGTYDFGEGSTDVDTPVMVDGDEVTATFAHAASGNADGTAEGARDHASDAAQSSSAGSGSADIGGDAETDDQGDGAGATAELGITTFGRLISQIQAGEIADTEDFADFAIGTDGEVEIVTLSDLHETVTLSDSQGDGAEARAQFDNAIDAGAEADYSQLPEGVFEGTDYDVEDVVAALVSAEGNLVVVVDDTD